MFITEDVAGELKKAINDACEALLEGPERWSNSAIGRCGIYVTGRKDRVIELLRWWYGLLDERVCVGGEVTSRVESVRRMLYDRVMVGLGCIGSMRGCSQLECTDPLFGLNDLDKALEEYQSHGFAGVSIECKGPVLSPSSSASRIVVNPTFLADVADFSSAFGKSYKGATAQDISQVWRVHYASNPYFSIPTELWRVYQDGGPCHTHFVELGRKKRSLTPTEICFEMFSMRSDALGKALMTGKHIIILHCGDAFRLCDALAPQQPRAWSMEEIGSVRDLVLQFRRADAPTSFDMIDTSNISDDTGVVPILLSAAPLLASRESNPRAVLATDLMKGRGSSHADILKNCLGEVPLWLIPYAVGLQLDGLRSSNSRDSRTKADPSVAWTIYPRSFLALESAKANVAAASDFRIRWRRCYNNIDGLCISDSPEIENIVHRALELATTAGGRTNPIGVTTVARLVEALVKSGGLTQQWKQDVHLVVSNMMVAKAAAKTPFSMIPHYAGSYQALCCLAGLARFWELVGKDTRLAEAVVEVTSDWRQQDRGTLGGNLAIGTCEKSCNTLDYRFVDVVFSFGIGRQVTFTGYLSGNKVHVILPEEVSYERVLSVNVTATDIIQDIIALSATVVSRKLIPSNLYSPSPRTPSSQASFEFITREWLPDGAMHFVLRSAAMKRIREGAAVKCQLREGSPNVLDIIIAGDGDVRVATLSLPAEVSLNDVHLKVSRKSGLLDVTVPVMSCSPLGPTAAAVSLPRPVTGCSSNGYLNPVPKLPDETLVSLGRTRPVLSPGVTRPDWAALTLEVPMFPRGVQAAGSKGMNQMRKTLLELFTNCLDGRSEGRSWGGRAIVTLGRKRSMPDVVFLLSKDVSFDWTYGMTVSAAVCVVTSDTPTLVTDEVLTIQAGAGSEHHEVDENSQELTHWVEEYIPAAATLANTSLGRNTSLTESPSSSFWTTWLSWNSVPLSPECMEHFVPVALFPLGSSDTPPMRASSTLLLPESVEQMRDTINKELLGQPHKLDALERFARQSSTSGGGYERMMAEVFPLFNDLQGIPKSSGAESLTKGKVERHYCEACRKPGESRCSRCKKVYYCSIKCQKAAWSTHKRVCKEE
ncbi:hypothetical protein FOZ63_032373 [Perkinsus olseni]|uniref:MYND-type domain-containing protein n=1 Tax=Perkinsus olseni TaxID=32597 RepID=A0A7J6RND7_PEROL|nr:hypothetical protein FOZ63_032373 [Perkinsus olseni]